MTVAEIYTHIKTLAHDQSFSDSNLSLFINQAVAELRGKGYLTQDIRTEETVTVSDGTTAITTLRPVKHVIYCSADYTKDSGGLRLLTAANGDTDITVTYVSDIEDWDGTETNNVLDEWLYIYGGTYYACFNNMSPETQLYRAHFDNHIGRVFGDDALFNLPESMSAEIMGI